MPMENYDDYELQNARLAAQSSRGLPPAMGQELDYDDYELGNAQMARRSIADMARKGRATDTMMAHVTPGDVVVPRDVWMSNPTILKMVQKEFDQFGDDYRTHMVGSGSERINPETGQPEFFIKAIRKAFQPKNLLRTAATAAGFALGGPVGAAAGAGLGTKLTGGSLQESLLSAGGAYLGGTYAPSGDIAGNLTTNSITRPAGEALARSSIGNLVGNVPLASLAAQYGATTLAGTPIATGEVGGYESFAPAVERLDTSRPDNMELPGSLSNLSGLSDIQRTSQIATQGVEGQGSSKEGQDYFYNQIRRRLTDENSTADEVIPIEQNYLQRMGVAYQPGNVKSILEGIARKQAAA